MKLEWAKSSTGLWWLWVDDKIVAGCYTIPPHERTVHWTGRVNGENILVEDEATARAWVEAQYLMEKGMV